MHEEQLEFEHESVDGRVTESSHLSSEQSGARVNADLMFHCPRCLHEFDKVIFRSTLNPRHVHGAFLGTLRFGGLYKKVLYTNV